MQQPPHHGMNDHDVQPRYGDEKNAKSQCQLSKDVVAVKAAGLVRVDRWTKAR
jgi:hypothetical protein